MIWDRAPDGGQCTGTEGGAPCPGCGRRPGKNTSVSCAGCASENVNVWVRPRADAPDVCLCPACAEERDFHEAKAKSVPGNCLLYASGTTTCDLIAGKAHPDADGLMVANL